MLAHLTSPHLAQVIGDRVSFAVSHYIGVLSYIHSNPQNPFFKNNIYR
jgi:hypothetical protein